MSIHLTLILTLIAGLMLPVVSVGPVTYSPNMANSTGFGGGVSEEEEHSEKSTHCREQLSLNRKSRVFIKHSRTVVRTFGRVSIRLNDSKLTSHNGFGGHLAC